MKDNRSMDVIRFRIADLHCHPNLKTFGNSFSKNAGNKSHVWNYQPPTNLTKLFNIISGITKFTQADFTTMAKGNVKISFVSLYPFEKGFFINKYFNNSISAVLANFITSIGFNRIRFLQNHKDYFIDLNNEYHFFNNSCKEYKVEGNICKWELVSSWSGVKKNLKEGNINSVILTIEGAHVFNSGLNIYGKETDEKEVFSNVKKIKNWEHPPFFITFAHNFNNELCGHARSLNQLGPLVNQFENINNGFSNFGLNVAKLFLNNNNQKRILIDVKHMSLKSRLEYYKIIEKEYKNTVPIIVSHGAVTGINLRGKHSSSVDHSFFCKDDINFFDEELGNIAKTKGLFAIQMDGNRLTNKKKLKKSIFNFDLKKNYKNSAKIVWSQLQHIAEVLDAQEMDAWNTACLGSDFDGTINPLPGIWTANHLQFLANELLDLASIYLNNKNNLKLLSNKNMNPFEVVEKFIFNNIINFLKNNYNH